MIEFTEAAGVCRAAVSAGLAHPNNPPHGIVTLSIGIAALDGDGQGSFDAVIAEADAALYEAKRDGRDRVAVARTPATASACGPG